MFEQGHKQYAHTPKGYKKPAAELCRHFMETSGWAGAFAIANGEETSSWVTNRFGKRKKVKVIPDFDTRLTAYRLITSYGYGRPHESVDLTSGGVSVTEFIVRALSGGTSPSLAKEGPQ